MNFDHLFPYQTQGAAWLHDKKCALLADEMGLGKTIQAITAADIMYADRILVLCPAIGRFNWRDEWQQWSVVPRTIKVIESKADTITNTDAIVICSYDMADHFKEQFRAIKWDVVICDEAHYLKSRSAKRTIAVFGLPRKPGIAASAKHLWCLSGTPAPNNYSELYPMLRAFGVWQKDYWDFLNTFTNWYDAPFRGDVVIRSSKNAALLKELMAPIMLRRRKAEVLPQLPEIFYQHESIAPGEVDDEVWFPDPATGRKNEGLKEQLDAESAMLTNLMTMDRTPESGKLTAIEASKGALSTIRRWHGQSKVAPIAEMAAEAILSGAIDKLVIFAIHRNVIIDLEMRLKRFKPVTLFGGTPPVKRENNVKKFQTRQHCKIFIGQVQAAGTTITLTAAQHIWFVEQSWVPAENAQALMRVHRIGQNRKVFAKFFGVANSIDDRIARTVKQKTKDLADLFD